MTAESGRPEVDLRRARASGRATTRRVRPIGRVRTSSTAPAVSDRSRAFAIGLAAYLVSRICVVAGAGVRASQRVVDANTAGEPRPGHAVGLIADVLTSWDGLWYLAVAREGYPTSVPADVTYFDPEARAAFFPLYPAVVRVADAILPGGDTLAALAVNVVLGAVATVLVGVLAERLAGIEVATRSMVLFAVFPGSFVLSFAYAEAAMIVLAAGCLVALVDERWVTAGVLAAIATATRPNALALVVACAVAAGLAIHRRREWRSLVAPALAPLGFVAFQAYLGARTGERGVWFRIQREAWSEGTSFGTTALRNTWQFFADPLASPTDALTVATLVAMIVGLGCLVARPLPWPVIAYVIAVLVLMLLPATVTARPRFLFAAFPLVIAVAARWPRRDRDAWDLLMVASGAGLAVLTGLYGVFGAIP